MARLIATKELVFRTASELTQEGKSVTAQAIRDRIGGGSFSTIGRMLAEWTDQQQDVSSQAADRSGDVVEGTEESLVLALQRAQSDVYRGLTNLRLLDQVADELGFRLFSGVTDEPATMVTVERWLSDASKYLAMVRLGVRIADRRVSLLPSEAPAFKSDPLPFVCAELGLSLPMAEKLWRASRNKCQAEVKCGKCGYLATVGFSRVRDFVALAQAVDRGDWLCGEHNQQLWKNELRLSPWMELGLRGTVQLSRAECEFLHKQGLVESTSPQSSPTAAGRRYLDNPHSFLPTVVVSIPCAIANCKKENVVGKFFGDEARREQDKAARSTWCCGSHHRAALYTQRKQLDDNCGQLLLDLQQGALGYDDLRSRDVELFFLVDRGLAEGSEGKKRRGVYRSTELGTAWLVERGLVVTK